MGSPYLASLPRARSYRLLRCILFLIVAITITFSFLDTAFVSTRSTIQHHRFKNYKPDSLKQHDRMKSVRAEFLHAWYGYKDHAWMADSLRSLTGTRRDQFCGWSATLVDTLDTLWIMELQEEFEEAINATIAIDFRQTAEDCEINLFESTIRYLGGLVASYDLSRDARLLPKLVELGDILYGQFDTTNGMPCNTCKMIQTDQEKRVPGHDIPLADVGSFYLEFTRLSQITGDPKYFELVHFLTKVFESTQNDSSIPGLWPERVDAASIDGPVAGFATKSSTYSLGALSDSAYEYLVKAHLLLGGVTDRYSEMWRKASDAIRANLLFRAFIPQSDYPEVLFSGVATHVYASDELYVEPRIQHLGCFAGGMYALSSRLFDRPVDLDIGIQLTQGCIWAYENSPTGIMPETVTLLSCPDMVGPQCAWNDTAWQEAHANPHECSVGTCQANPNFPPGFLFSVDPQYLLRPEAIESVFILYRITGNEYYRDVGWRMFQDIIRHTRTPYGHGAIRNTMAMNRRITYQKGQAILDYKASQMDEMESFWLAETLKYFWLLFSEPDLISLDDWVFNTEAHPFKLTDGIRGF